MLETRAFEPEFLERLDDLVLGTKRARTVRAGQRTVGRTQGGGIEPKISANTPRATTSVSSTGTLWPASTTWRSARFAPSGRSNSPLWWTRARRWRFPRDDDKLGLALALGAGLAYIGMS